MLVSLADHCSRQGNLGEAAALARMAGDPARIGRYAQDHGALRIWVVHGFSVLQDFVENASPEVLEDAPVLRMMECIVHIKAGRIRVAQKLFEDLASTIAPQSPLARDVEIVRVTLMTYGCSLERTGDLEMLKRIIAEQADDPAMSTFLSTLSCILNSQRARFDTALASLIDARAQARKASSRYNLMFLHLHEATIHLAQGKLKQAGTCVSEARRGWKREFAHDIGVETVISALSAAIEFEAGRLTSARSAVRKSAYRMPDAEAWFDIYFAAYDTMIRLDLTDHGMGATLEAIETESAKLRAQGLPRVANLVVAIGLCIAGEASLRGMEVTPPPHWSVPEIGATASWQEVEVFTLATAYGLHRRGCRQEAIELLEAARAEARERGLQRSCLRFLLADFSLSAPAPTGEAARRDSMLREAVSIGARTGMRQVFREFGTGPLAASLASIATETTLDDVERGFARSVLNRLREPEPAASGKLSERELEVLRLLQAGGSDKHLARQLGISEHGVRFHLKSIFKKLSVHDRLAAVAASRKLEVIA